MVQEASARKLVYPKEPTLFSITLVIALLFWVLLLVGTVGLALIYVLLFAVILLFAQAAFVSYIRGTGVRITKTQYPDLHQSLLRCCNKIELKTVPEAYLLRTDFFNALATRFLGRHFVVLFTDVVDALEDRPAAVDFYIGHELGHVHRRHLSFWHSVASPAAILPVLGPALRRAEEYTCDRYGAHCCENDDDVKAALAAIAAGNTRWKTMNMAAYLEQNRATGGFWMSFNELTNDYPWLTKRMASALAFRQGESVRHPRRHPMAFLLSIFVPRLGVGGAGGFVSLMIILAIIGILAAVAIPAYQDYVVRAISQNAFVSAQEVRARVEAHRSQTGSWPQSLRDLGGESEVLEVAKDAELSLHDGGMIAVEIRPDQYLVLKPEVNPDGQLSWTCYGQDLPRKFLPPDCQ